MSVVLAKKLSEPTVGPSSDPAFEQVFRDLAQYVLRVLPRLGVAARDVEDVAQDVFWAVHRGLPSFEGRSSVKTWVYGICIRTVSNYRDRAYRRYEQLPGDVEPERVDQLTPARSYESQRALLRLDAVLAELGETQRAVFVLHEIEGLSVLEIAEALSCSKFTIYGRLYAAQARVRKALLEERD